MEHNNLLNLFTESERLLSQYQNLYRLTVRLCGVLNIKDLMKEITSGLIEAFDATYAYMVVFHDETQYIYPKADGIEKSDCEKILATYSPNAQSLKEIIRLDAFICAPIRDTESEPPLAILILVDENARLDFESTKKKISALSQVVAAATRRVLVEEERKKIGKRAKEAEIFCGLIGESQPMQGIKKQILQVSQTDANVLIQGETGSGKELVARAIHENSNRKDKPFVVFNCGALSETLIESELFGHVKGAFTGAIQDRKGLFKQADGGTIFLDEIGEMPPAQQVILLRVLENGEIRAVGSDKTEIVNVRVIAATNKDLRYQVEKSSFRKDLYFRLARYKIELPQLRERDKDVLILAKHFLYKYSAEDRYFTKDTEDALMNYTWPGNVRELEGAIGHAVMFQTKEITPNHLPIEVTQQQNVSPALSEAKTYDIEAEAIEPLVRKLIYTIANTVSRGISGTKVESRLDRLCATKDFADAVSSCNIRKARAQLENFLLEEVCSDGSLSDTKAAEKLGISRSQLNRILKNTSKELGLFDIECGNQMSRFAGSREAGRET